MLLMEQQAIQDNTPQDTRQCWKNFQEVLNSIGKTSRDVKNMSKAYGVFGNIEKTLSVRKTLKQHK
jgi:hypothetical protein